jgi:hypothetical protein
MYHALEFWKFTKVSIMSTKARKLATSLLRENRRGRSYRTISRDDFQGKVDQSTLSRIARTRGAWLPKDESILIALGLKQPKEPKPPRAPDPEWLKEVKKRIAAMAKQTRIDLELQK